MGGRTENSGDDSNKKQSILNFRYKKHLKIKYARFFKKRSLTEKGNVGLQTDITCNLLYEENFLKMEKRNRSNWLLYINIELHLKNFFFTVLINVMTLKLLILPSSTFNQLKFWNTLWARHGDGIEKVVFFVIQS